MTTERMTPDQLRDMSLRNLYAAIEVVEFVLKREPDNTLYSRQATAAGIRLIKAVG